MAALPDLITVAQFRELPEVEACSYELHDGEVVAVTWPKCWHLNRQHRLRDLLTPKVPGFEVKSPSNTKAELQGRASLCLTHGSLEFWIADEEQRTIAVFHRDGSKVVYCSGDAIPLTAFGSDCLAVDEIFA